MATEDFRILFHNFAPPTASMIYAAPSGYQVMVTPIRQVSAVPSGTPTIVGVSLYQGSGVPGRYLQNNLQIDPEGIIVDDSPIMVTASTGIFASANVASGVTLHLQGVVTPI